MLKVSVPKKLIQRTSQCVNWNSGAQDMMNSLSLFNSYFDYSHDRLLDRSLGRLLARSLARSLAKSLDRSLARSLT